MIHLWFILRNCTKATDPGQNVFARLKAGRTYSIPRSKSSSPSPLARYSALRCFIEIIFCLIRCYSYNHFVVNTYTQSHTYSTLRWKHLPKDVKQKLSIYQQLSLHFILAFRSNPTKITPFTMQSFIWFFITQKNHFIQYPLVFYAILAVFQPYITLIK